MCAGAHSLWEPFGASGSLWEPLGASGSLWELLYTILQNLIGSGAATFTFRFKTCIPLSHANSRALELQSSRVLKL
jgi:hypothetical protein